MQQKYSVLQYSLIQKSTSACMLYYYQKGCVQGHVTSLNFGK